MELLTDAARESIADEWFGSYLHEVDAVITRTQAGTKQYGFVDYVDGIARDSDEYVDIRAVVPEIEPEMLALTFGEDSIIWAAANVLEAYKAERHYKQMAKLTGIQPGMAQQAVRWNQLRYKESKARNLLFQVGLSACVANVDSLDIPALVQDHPAEGVTVSNQRASQYNLVPLSVKHNFTDGQANHLWNKNDTEYYDIWLDGPVGLALTYRDRPIAVASYGTFEGEMIGLLQIQGVTGYKNDSRERLSPRGLAPLDWQSLFITIAEIAAQETGAYSVRIPAAARNRWLNNTAATGQYHLTTAAAVRAYDEPALRCGYSLKDDGNWHKAII